ncbi:MAG TPA: DUF2318 domain-containing protein [Patescibacteria group bacterium]|jgi:uncharacterized membrane protein|nr:DUF2318 domain-containing protein [Patescibacteria group bacterium]
MSKSKKGNANSKKQMNIYMIAVAILILVFVGYKLIAPQTNEDAAAVAGNVTEGVLDGINLKLAKADITEKANFYSYKEAGTYMEVIALKADDGTIRTALNTCQVCYDSGKGYYEQVGDTLVCQNCGNVFGVNDVEVVKGGCNPVPILEENKTEDGEFVTISGEFLADNKGYFERWKR